MRPGICLNPTYALHPWTSAPNVPPSPTTWQRLYKDLGIRAVRSGVPVIDGAVPPATEDDPWTFNFAPLDAWLGPMFDANPNGPMIDIYFNFGGCHPAASEGQPAYVTDSIGRWPPGSKDTPDTYCGPNWWNDPTNGAAGIHAFNQDPLRKDSVVNAITGNVMTGAELAAIDAKMLARPYLLDPPTRDPKYVRDLTLAIMAHYRGLVRFIGEGNEPGGDLLSRFATSATMTERRFPEVYIPLASALAEFAALSSDGVRARVIGCEADSADVLAQFLDADQAFYESRERDRWGRQISACDVISIHPYGEIVNQAYSTMKAFEEVLFGRQHGRRIMATEIDHTDPQVLYDFTVMMMAKHPGIDVYYLNPGRTFFEAGAAWNTAQWPADTSKPQLSVMGLKFVKLFKENR